MVSSLFRSLRCLFLFVFINYIQQIYLMVKNMLALSCYVKQGNAYSRMVCYCRSQKVWSDSSSSFSICLCLFSKAVFIPLKGYIALWSSLSASCMTDLEENNVLFLHNATLSLKRSAMYCLWQIFFHYCLLKWACIWFLLYMLEKQEFCLTGLMTWLSWITVFYFCLAVICIHTSFSRQNCIMLQDCIWAGSPVWWLVLSLCNEFLDVLRRFSEF